MFQLSIIDHNGNESIRQFHYKGDAINAAWDAMDQMCEVQLRDLNGNLVEF